MELLLRYFDGCPNWQVARDRLWEALAAEGKAFSDATEAHPEDVWAVGTQPSGEMLLAHFCS